MPGPRRARPLSEQRRRGRPTATSPSPCAGPLRRPTAHTQRARRQARRRRGGALKALFPVDATQGAAAGFTGREPGATGVQTSTGRPNTDPYGFMVKVVATTEARAPSCRARTTAARSCTATRTCSPASRSDHRRRRGRCGAGDADRRRRVLARVRRPRRRQPQRDDLRRLRRLRPRAAPGRLRAAGWPVRGDRPPFVRHHVAARGYASGEVSADLGGAILASVAVADMNRDGVPEVYAADLDGQVYGWDADGQARLRRRVDPDLLRRAAGAVRRELATASTTAPSTASSARRCWPTSTATTRAPGDRRRRDGPPRLRLEPRRLARSRGSRSCSSTTTKVASIDPSTHRVTFKPDAGSEQQGAIIDHAGGRGPRRRRGRPGRRRAPRDRRRHQRGVLGRPRRRSSTPAPRTAPASTCSTRPAPRSTPSSTPAGATVPTTRCRSSPATPASTRSTPTATATRTPLPGGAVRDGWPTSLGIVLTGLLPVVGEGVTGSPVVAPASCTPGGEAAPRVGAAANNGPAYILDEDGDSCYGQDPQGRDIPLQTDVSAAAGARPPLPAGGRPAGVRRPRRGLAVVPFARRRADARARPRAARVPAQPGLHRRLVGPGRRPVPPELPGDDERPAVPDRPGGRRHRRPPRRGGDRGLRQQGPRRLQRRGCPGRRRLAQAHDRLDRRHTARSAASARSTPTATRARSS